MSGLTALVLAGSRPGKDDFAKRQGTDLKALIPVQGEPMVRRPVSALLATDGVESVIVVAQQPERIAEALPADPRLAVTASAETIAATLQRLIENPATKWPVLVTTADHALLGEAMIRDFIDQSGDADIAIAVVERGSLMKRLPQSQRTWHKFRGGAYSGANLFLLRSAAAGPAIALWRSVEQDRKKGARMLLALGPLSLLGAALRLRSLQQTLASVGRKLRLNIRAVEMRDPLAAVDVDKDADLTLVEQLLRGEK